MWLKHPAISCYWLILLCLCSSRSTFASVCGDVHTGMKASSPPSSLISFLPPPHLSPLQPALLYLVPTCLGIPSAVALLKGDLSAMLQWVYTQQHATVFIFSAFKLESEVRANTGYFMRAYCLTCSNFNQHRTTSLLESAWKLCLLIAVNIYKFKNVSWSWYKVVLVVVEVRNCRCLLSC